ncbi:MAG: FMN-binding protein [Lentisphaeria bacterium]|nr:FMN-binding protein [Lentisphaeria bacterium]
MRHGLTAALSAGVLLLTAAGTDRTETAGESFAPALRKLLPGYTSLEYTNAFTCRILDRSNAELGKLHLEDAERFPRRNGYGGTIEIGIVTDSSGRIIGVVPGRNRETPAYLARLDRMKFFRLWNSLTLEEAEKKKVDTVTRATFSSGAVITGVRNAAKTALDPEPEK